MNRIEKLKTHIVLKVMYYCMSLEYVSGETHQTHEKKQNTPNICVFSFVKYFNTKVSLIHALLIKKQQHYTVNNLV